MSICTLPQKLRAEEDAQSPTKTEIQINEKAEAAPLENSGAKPVRILAVCGNGQGSSMMMKMKIGQYLEKKGSHTSWTPAPYLTINQN